LTECELVRRAQSGDRDAFCALVGLHQRRLYALALYLFRSPADAEDTTQETWLRAWRSLAEYRAEGTFYAWARQILTGVFLNECRRRERHPIAGWEERSVEGVPDRGDIRIRNAVLIGEVAEALATLPGRQRLVFSLKHGEGMSYEEIAAEMECSAGTVKKALFRAVQKLREALGCTTAPQRGGN